MGMNGYNAVSVPTEPRLKLCKKGNGGMVDPSLYSNVGGGLRYLVHTRPDICFTVGYLSRFMEAPTSEHWSEVKHLLHYIAGTNDVGVLVRTSQETKAKLVGYSDADMADDTDH
jgi:hypothetical protein